MITTLDIKQQQLRDGYFSIGTGPEIILIMGSCRVCPYVNYLNYWNQGHYDEFTICCIDPFNWNWDEKDERVDYAEVLRKLETDERILKLLKSVHIFIHEYYQHAGMFNTQLYSHGLSIYNYGMKPKIDICIPNFNDYFILCGDIVSFDLNIRKKAIQDYNVIGKLSAETEKEMFEVSEANIKKFIEICDMASLPEMGIYFMANMAKKRFFWTFNHVSAHFTSKIFELMNDKWLRLKWEKQWWDQISKEDMFANNYTYLTEYDVKKYGYDWGEEIKNLKDKL